MSAITITAAGELRFVWADELADMTLLGAVDIRRASHVEATADGHWTADMSPVDGPVLGPYRLRGEALTAEREWLGMHGY